ncbi:fumarylacetoacetase [Streptomyces albus]|uniref:fumarylacetoacetase n=1 Tax=Streptomyces albus TaxID=1888 RepID=A0A8H1QNK2_9ACTN|nr:MULTISPECIES: fumarylacetoacetase [Streptomyces]KPC91874.1 fumarylacetoacetase [Streptomyces sp. NRRL F-6602]TGG75911.1 fumarylacetoacetase [Streptomyces albus]UVN55376.1 fumarylacetoacetase [Streptomyces albus]GHJ23656.1 fumarylacetoacetase [Streptomyces albus]
MSDTLFGPDNLPYGLFSTPDRPGHRRLGVRYGDDVLDLGAAADAFGSAHAEVLRAPSLNPLLAAGRPVWQAVRSQVRSWLTEEAHRETAARHLLPLSGVQLHLPFEVADYVDFYASEHHATNVGRIFRPDSDALTPNWKHLPIGYHGRAGTVVVSGTPVVRPQGQRKPPQETAPVFGPSQRLDIEAEVGFVVGTPSQQGRPVALADFREHVFGVTLVNDWSARDIQAWEYVPLGPFLGKSFATSVSPWITPLDALDAARVAPPSRDFPLLPYLDDAADGIEPGGYDLRITVELNGHVIAEPPFSGMYWTAAQQLAHLTVNGASLRTGDLYASGTVSGPEKGQRGCLLELTWGGNEPLELPDGKRTFLEDGDEVTLRAWAPGPDGTRIGLGEVTGRVLPNA